MADQLFSSSLVKQSRTGADLEQFRALGNLSKWKTNAGGALIQHGQSMGSRRRLHIPRKMRNALRTRLRTRNVPRRTKSQYTTKLTVLITVPVPLKILYPLDCA